MDYGFHANKRKRFEQSLNTQKLASKVWLWILRILSVIIVGAVLIIGGLLLGGFVGIIDNSPIRDEYDINDFTSYLYHSDGTVSTAIYTSVMRAEVGIEDISENLQKAVVAIEDNRFYDHNGIDIEGIIRSGVNILKGDDLQGGSTITQQVIKNIALTSDTAITRKVQEWYMALNYEYNLTQKVGREACKKQILETYLNYVNFGNGQYGAQSASHFYYDKEAKDLSISEAAVLAGVLNAPSYYDPINEPEASRERQLLVLGNMLRYGMISQSEYDAAKADDVFGRIKANTDDPEEENVGPSVHYNYYEEAAMNQVMDDLVHYLGYSEEKAERMLYHGGLAIYLAQDQKTQEAIDKTIASLEGRGSNYWQLNYALSIYNDDFTSYENYGLYNLLYYYRDDCEAAVEKYRAEKLAEHGLTAADEKRYAENVEILYEPQATALVMDYHNGYVLGFSSGIGEKTVDMALSRALDSTRQPGSCFKVLSAFAPAIEVAGRTAATVYDDVPLNPRKTGGYTVQNWWNTQTWFGFSTIREGLAQSMNIIAVRCCMDIGVETGYNFALNNMKFTTLTEDDCAATIALGGLANGVTNLEMTNAYGSILNQGIYVDHTFYTKVFDHDGNLLLDRTEGGAQFSSSRSMSEAGAFIVTNMMQSTVTLGTGWQTASDLYLPHRIPIAAKTGTSENYTDYWEVAASPYYVCTVWCGLDMMRYSGNHGSIELNASGSYNRDYRAYIWNSIMNEIHEDLEYRDFPSAPDDVVRRSICQKSGKLATDDCAGHTYYEYFIAGTEPGSYCNCHTSAQICTISGLLAVEGCPTEEKFGCIREEDLIELAKIIGGAEDMSYFKDNKDRSFRAGLGFAPGFVQDFIPTTECPGPGHHVNEEGLIIEDPESGEGGGGGEGEGGNE